MSRAGDKQLRTARFFAFYSLSGIDCYLVNHTILKRIRLNAKRRIIRHHAGRDGYL